jgi:hypothetical protein
LFPSGFVAGCSYLTVSANTAAPFSWLCKSGVADVVQGLLAGIAYFVGAKIVVQLQLLLLVR